jgi:hypothetical protein
MDYYKILGLPYGASASNVKLRYRELSKTHHPDRGGSQLRMARINEAYQTLSNPTKRARYDAALRRQKLSPPPSRAVTPRPAPRPQTPTHAEPLGPIFETPIVPQKRNRRGFWWTLIVGVTSTCFIAVGLLAMHGVSIASPDSSEAAADRPAPTIAVDPPKDQPLDSPSAKITDSASTPVVFTPPTQEAVPAQNAVPQNATTTEECTHKTFGLFTFTRCRPDNDTSSCTELKNTSRHNYTCRSKY